MIRSIFSKLLLSHIVVILVSTITLGLLFTYLVRWQVVENKRHELLHDGNTVISLLTPTISAGRIPSDHILGHMSDLVGASLWLINQNGTVIAGKPPERWATRFFPENTDKIASLFAGTPQSWMRTERRNADPAIIVALPIPDAPVPTALFLYAPIVGINKTTDTLERLLLYALLLGVFSAVVVGFVTSRSLTRPIANISQAAHKFAKGDYLSRTTATANDEIGSLGRTFNGMAESLSHTEQNRRDFLANVSHELKTPVASIQALAETILDGLATRPEQQQRYLKAIVDESNRINRLIGDLLDLAQLEAGELSVINEQVDLHLFLTTEKDKYIPLLTEKQLSVKLDIPANIRPVLADPDRLSQIMTNLVSNAIRHALPESDITITVRQTGQEISIAVSDHGPGIPSADLPYIWDRFYRAEKSRVRSGGGTGLGLSIVKELVQTMGGDISVSSIPNTETTFTFTLPIAAGKNVNS